MEKIVVATDLSTNSKTGIRFALQLSRQTGCQLIFYHAVELMNATSRNDNQFKRLSAGKISQKLSQLKNFVNNVNRYNPTPSQKFDFKVEANMYFSESIVRYAKKIKADGICLSTHGAGRIEKLFGTNASTLITTSPIPIITVPKSYRVKPVRDLFYASDFVSLGRELKRVHEFAEPLKAKIKVFNYDYLIHLPEVKAKLEKKAIQFGSPGTSFTYKKLDIGILLSELIRKDIQKTKPSMVVLFTKQNRRWYDRLFSQNASASLAFHTPLPMLTFRKPGK